MSRDASITIDWIDGPHTFRLGWGELVKLQEAVDAGPYVTYQRLMLGQWRVEEISATIRLGLVGGGMEPAAALKLVQGYVEARPPLESLPLAQGILGTALMGAPDESGEVVGEAMGKSSTTSPTENSAPASSTDGSQPSDASPTKPTG